MAEPTDIIEHDPYDPDIVAQYEAELDKRAEEAPTSARDMLNRRKLAYYNVFHAGDTNQADIDIVLADMMWFSKVWFPSYDIKDGIHAEELAKRKDGRRELFCRIKDFSCLDSDALFLKYTDATTK